MCFTTTQWEVVDLCINCDNLFTAKDISSLMKDKYYMELITCQYCLRSIGGLPLDNHGFSLDANVVVNSLASIMLVLVYKSHMYFCWDKNKSFDVVIASMPKKHLRWIRSFKENRLTRVLMNWLIIKSWRLVTMVLSTYTRCMTWFWCLFMKRELLNLELWKSIERMKEWSSWNQARGA